MLILDRIAPKNNNYELFFKNKANKYRYSCELKDFKGK